MQSRFLTVSHQGHVVFMVHDIDPVIIIHCVPKKRRQNSNHYNYGISYQN